MKKILILFFVVSLAFAKWIDIDKTHSDVRFVVKHLGISSINGYFVDYEAAIDFDENTKRIRSLEANIKANSIYTKNEARDYNLTSEIFFDTSKFKTISFKMTSSDDKYVYGDLTIKDITKRIRLEYTYNGSAKNVEGHLVHSLTLKGDIKRREYDIGKDYPLEFVNDHVRIVIDIQGRLIGEEPKPESIFNRYKTIAQFMLK